MSLFGADHSSSTGSRFDKNGLASPRSGWTSATESAGVAVPAGSPGWGRRCMFIYIDADACPVKEEVYRVARRYAIKVYVVANMPLRVPAEALIELIVVRGGFDAADDWIVERVVPGDIVITADILLADRCLRKSGRVLGPKGVAFTEDAIGDAVTTRRPSRHAPPVGRDWRGPCPVRQGGPLAVPVQTR